jgi:hypothetical protein
MVQRFLWDEIHERTAQRLPETAGSHLRTAAENRAFVDAVLRVAYTADEIFRFANKSARRPFDGRYDDVPRAFTATYKGVWTEAVRNRISNDAHQRWFFLE